MSFNPAPPERNRFTQHLVIKADNVTEVNEYLDNLKGKLAEECVLTAAQVDEQPNSYVISADFVVMPTNQYRDHVASAFDHGVLGAMRSMDPSAMEIDDEQDLDETIHTLVQLALVKGLSSKARDEVMERIAELERAAGRQEESLATQAELAIRTRLEAIQASAKHYRQAVLACADAIQLLNITLADMNEDQEEESDAE